MNYDISCVDGQEPANNGLDIADLINASNAKTAAIAALRIGLRPVPLHAIDTVIKTKKGERLADGKIPVGEKWGITQWTPKTIEHAYDVEGRGVGLLMGPAGRLIDIEIDRPKDQDPQEFDERADAELAQLCGGEIPRTAGWTSSRGRHRLFLWDDRLGVFDKQNTVKHGALEIRLGAAKQIQSAIPPTKHRGGQRKWDTETTIVARLPEAAVKAILSLADRPIEKPENAIQTVVKFEDKHARGTQEKRLIGHAKKLADNIRRANKGDAATGRHPTALASARTMAGLASGWNREDLAPQLKTILLEGYRDSKPELDASDAEFVTTIDDGWAYGLAEPMTMDERPLAAPVQSQPMADQNERKMGPAATLATHRARAASREFVWPYFLCKRALTLIDGVPGVGKSRFVAELLRRIKAREPWPDGQQMLESDQAVFLWMAADSNYDQLVETGTAFGLADEDIVFIGDEENLYDFTDLTQEDTLWALEYRIKEYRPPVVVIDTATNACGATQQTDRALIGQIAKRLLKIANEHAVCIVLIGHQNARGGSYGETWPANCDCRITMEVESDAVCFQVVKARWDSNKAPVLRGKQSDTGWTFEVEPRDIQTARDTQAMSAHERAKKSVAEYVSKYPETVAKKQVVERLMEVTGIGKSTFYTVIGELIRDGEIIEVEKDFGKFKVMVLTAPPS